ncbi:DUF2470 domain-containing protein [Nocardiopsis alborubida]|uniref:DUF2470 domain-containing protein n=1 Tax=Nocardiopsis alborubida TaxID=146802 RepID=A0A7X6MLV5_9ACTN|nr:DUF2470 domain-containing protein [Nocardiopsis alborubida]NKZ01866.1 DUF2470 domain-containing protein [Nocardiopsis alborubida]
MNAPVPPPADRARSILARCGPVTVAAASDRFGETGDVRLEDVPRHVHTDGAVSFLLPDGHPLTSPRAEEGPVVMAEFTDLSPVLMRDRVRAVLWVSGAVEVLEHTAARARAARLPEAATDDRLLEIGHGLTMAVLRTALVVQSDHDGAHVLGPAELAAARPDPFCLWEEPWLRHLDQDHPDLVGDLLAAAPGAPRGGRPRPLGVDRLGLRLRVEAARGYHDVHLPFTRPARTPDEVAVQVHRLAGHPVPQGFDRG